MIQNEENWIRRERGGGEKRKGLIHRTAKSNAQLPNQRKQTNDNKKRLPQKQSAGHDAEKNFKPNEHWTPETDRKQLTKHLQAGETQST